MKRDVIITEFTCFSSCGWICIYLFVNLVYTRYLFIKLGKKAEFEPNLKERINTDFNQWFWSKEIIQRQEKWSDAFSIIL